MNAVDRRRLQNRDAQRRRRNKTSAAAAAATPNKQNASTLAASVPMPDAAFRVVSSVLAPAESPCFSEEPIFLAADHHIRSSEHMTDWLDLIPTPDTQGTLPPPPDVHQLPKPSPFASRGGDATRSPHSADHNTSLKPQDSTPYSGGTITATAAPAPPRHYSSSDEDGSASHDSDSKAAAYAAGNHGGGQSALHIAARSGSAQMTTMLLGMGSSVGETDARGNTPLHVAVLFRRLPVIRLLLQHGADPNALNACGYSPLHAAVSTGSVDAVQALVSHGGDLTKKVGEA